MNYLFYNSSAKNQAVNEELVLIREQLKNQNAKEYDVKQLSDCRSILMQTKTTDTIHIVGGDGTLNHFINDIATMEELPEIFYYPAGTGNDFSRDIYGMISSDRIRLNDYVKVLPTVTVNGKTMRFINGIGFGIDGYCCEEGDKQRAKGNKKINYTAIAIKGLLFKFKPRNAEVTVDGVTKKYKKVWLAPAMYGKYYGGGMMIAPNQDRMDPEHKLTSVVLYGTGKIKTLMRFSSIFTGEHVKYKDMMDFVTGKDIAVKFDGPCALQVDGETFSNVTEFSVNIK